MAGPEKTDTSGHESGATAEVVGKESTSDGSVSRCHEFVRASD